MTVVENPKEIIDMVDYRDGEAYIATVSGRKFHLFNPAPEEIDIDDIAHSLSNICRFTGHVQNFYSVAEHCLRAAKYASKKNKLWALLHDAMEAYYNDLSRPLKHHPDLSLYRDAEHYAQSVMATKWNLGPYPVEVKEIDNLLVVTEAKELMPRAAWTEGLPCYKPRPFGFIPYTPGEAAFHYKAAFLKYMEEREDQ